MGTSAIYHSCAHMRSCALSFNRLARGGAYLARGEFSLSTALRAGVQTQQTTCYPPAYSLNRLTAALPHRGSRRNSLASPIDRRRDLELPTAGTSVAGSLGDSVDSTDMQKLGQIARHQLMPHAPDFLDRGRQIFCLRYRPHRAQQTSSLFGQKRSNTSATRPDRISITLLNPALQPMAGQLRRLSAARHGR